MTLILKNVYIDKLDDIVKKYNNTYPSTIKMKHRRHILTLVKKLKKKNPKFKIGYTVRIPKHKNIFARGYSPNSPEETFVINKVKNTLSWTYVINDFNGKKLLEIFAKNELQKQIRKSLELKK